jgi:phosphatidylglycerophosphatase A
MLTPKEKYRSNLNFTVVTFFILVSLATGFYLGLISSKGGIIETDTGSNSVYQNIWQYRSDIFNLLLIAIAFVFIVLLALVVIGRNRLNRDDNEEIEGLERLGELFKKRPANP